MATPIPSVDRPLRLLFMGTPEFAVPSLQALLTSRHQVLAVITQPDKPAGRGQQVTAPPIKQLAVQHGLPVYQPEKLRDPQVADWIHSWQPDAIVLVAYGKIIPQEIIEIPPLGIINVHASLLPKYRGAAPIQWAIAEGETRTGVTTMLIDAGLDTGDILLARETEIGPEETAVELSERLARMGAELLLETLEGLQTGRIQPRPQDHSQATYAPMLKKEDGWIDWNWPAQKIHNRIRGFQPWPGAYTTFRGKTFHIWRSRITGETINLEPGEIACTGQRLQVGCGDGQALELLEVQLEGRKRMDAKAFLCGHPIRAGERLGS